MSSNATLLYAPNVRNFRSPYPMMALVLGLLAIYLATSFMGGPLNIASYLVLVVGFLFWLYLASRNMQNLTVSTEGTPMFSPGWSVGWWFVPFANLWQPFPMVRELWQRSHPIGRETGYVTILTAIWWLSFIASRILSWYYFGAIFETYTPTMEEVQRNFVGYLVAGGLELLATVMIAIIVWQISRQQVMKRATLTDVRP